MIGDFAETPSAHQDLLAALRHAIQLGSFTLPRRIGAGEIERDGRQPLPPVVRVRVRSGECR
jgi:hypothetical protein